MIFRAVLCSSEASKYLVEVLEAVSPSELDDVIERVLDAVEKQPCKYSAVSPYRLHLNVQSAAVRGFQCLSFRLFSNSVL